MAEFFVSPESQQAIQREIGQRRQQFANARARATEEMGQRAAYARELNPQASNQLISAYATTPQMSDDQFQELSARESATYGAQADEGMVAAVGNVLNDVGMGAWSTIKAGIRGAFTLWDGVQQEAIMRPLTAASLADPETGSIEDRISQFPQRFAEAYEAYGDSPLRNIIQGDLEQPVDPETGQPIQGEGTLGHGLFPGGAAQARTDTERQRLMDQHGVENFGGAIAKGLFSTPDPWGGRMQGPGDSAYDITAGVAQFGGEVALDPVAWGTLGTAGFIKGAKGIGGGSRTLGSAIRSISPEKANAAAHQVADAGLVATRSRSTVLLDQANRLFKNPKVLDEIAAADEYTIWRRMKMDRLGLGRGDDRMAQLVADLGRTSDPAEAGRILVDAASRGWVRERGFYKGAGRLVKNPKETWRSARLGDKDSVFGRALAGMPEFRFGGAEPKHVLSADNRMEAARDLDGVLRLGKVSEQDRAAIVSRVFRSQGPDDMLQIRDDATRALAKKMNELGVTKKQAAKMAGKKVEDVDVDGDVLDILLKTSRDEINRRTGYLLGSLGRPDPPPWKGQASVTMPDGSEVPTNSISAGLIVHANKRAIPLPNARDVRHATAKYSAMRNIYQSNGWAMTESVARGATRYLFKFPTLFTRIAYPMRNNLENGGRTAGAGYHSIFSNARAYFGLGIFNRNKFRDLAHQADGVLATGRGFYSTSGRYGVVDEAIEATDDAPTRMRARWKDTGEEFEVEDLEAFRAAEVESVSASMDEWARETGALTNNAAGMWADDGAKKLGSWRTFRKGEQGDVKAWRSQLGRFANDPIAARVADTAQWTSHDELIDSVIDDGLVDELVNIYGDEAEAFFYGSPSTGGGVDVFHGTFGQLGHPESVARHGGIHVGSRRAAEDALDTTRKSIDLGFEAPGDNPRVIKGRLSSDRIYRVDDPIHEGQLADITGDERRLEELRGQYDAIAYVNEVEDVGETSYLVLNRSALSTAEDAPSAVRTANREKVSEYVGWADEHIDNLTGGDTRLRQTIATRNLNGVNFNDLTKNKRIDQILREQYYDRMPMEVMGDEFIEDANTTKRLFKEVADGWVDFFATKPENHFTRYPLLAQVFADDIARSMPTLADDALRRELVQRAADAGFEGKRFNHIAQAAQDAAGQKGLADDLEDVIDAAKFHSTDKTLEIAFDATQRSSFQEAFDAFVPFWDAFAEIGQSWGRIMRDNPNVIGRGMQTLQGGRETGFVYTNEMGEEVFAMPGGGALANMLGLNGVGAMPAMRGSVEGLNLITQGFGPGVGPLVQWGVGAFLPKSPDLQWVREVLTPYGSSVTEPADLADVGKLWGDLEPAWFQKVRNAFSEGSADPDAWNSAAGNTMKALGTVGKYDMGNPEDVRRFEEDVRKGTKWSMFMRGILQMSAPTGPQVEWNVETDPDGTQHRVSSLAEDFFKMLDSSQGDYAVATQAFIEQYGVEPFWIAQSKYNELVEGPRTQEGFNWIGRHADAAERHRDVVGYFVPAEDPVAPPDYGVFKSRMDSGDIESLTAEQQIQLAAKNKARQIYAVQRQRMEDLPYQLRTRQLRQVRDRLEEDFPGWQDDVPGVAQRLSRDEKIRKLELAVDDPGLSDSPVTEPLSIYLRKRREAFDVLAQRAAQGGASTLKAQANADLRDWLYGIGQDLTMRHGEFQGLWQTLLSSEVEE